MFGSLAPSSKQETDILFLVNGIEQGPGQASTPHLQLCIRVIRKTQRQNHHHTQNAGFFEPKYNRKSKATTKKKPVWELHSWEAVREKGDRARSAL